MEWKLTNSKRQNRKQAFDKNPSGDYAAAVQSNPPFGEP